MYKQNIKLQKENQENIKDPIYYNLTLTSKFDYTDNTGSNIIANIQEINQQPVLFESGDWWIGLMRCSIPTCLIPKAIFPVQKNPNYSPPYAEPPLIDELNYTYNFITFKYATGLINAGTVTQKTQYANLTNINDYQQNVTFISEIYNPLPIGYEKYLSYPNRPVRYNSTSGQYDTFQDVQGTYYYIWEMDTIVTMFNNAINALYPRFRSALALLSTPINIPANTIPFFTFNQDTQKFEFNAPKQLYNQSSYPRIEVFIDDISVNWLQCPNAINSQNYYNTISNSYQTPKDAILLKVNDLNNNTFTFNTLDYLKMISYQSSVNNFASLQKIVFEVSGDISLKNNEFDAPPQRFNTDTENNNNSIQKPYVSMLVDLEVNADQWYINNNFIQFQASAIEQIRLLSLAEKSFIKNFNIGVSWVDVFGIKRPLEIPVNGSPLTMKLAFFNKNFYSKI